VKMKTKEIRQLFLDHFEADRHVVLPSSSLVPSNDPTLFFTNAGMVQFKDVFLGADKREYKRATTVQRCLRVSGKHNDLENVGQTPRHHTFFEMLGNFSFGDYFKEEAIKNAWQLLTEGYKLDPDRLWVTIYRDDDEAQRIWTEVIEFPPERLQKLGEKDNFWSMGDTGPCGPCSEIHYDHGPAYGDDPNGPAGETDRYVEIWNLVFMQYDRDSQGVLHPLPRPSIDTGMGLERLAAILQGVYSNYDTDIFQAVIQETAELAGIEYGKDDENDMALRVIADHARATAFLIADGVMPSNEGRGYVLRRIARRAIRYGVRLGLKEPFLWKAADVIIEEMGETYPDLLARRAFIKEVAKGEEERFSETLDKGLVILEDAFRSLPAGGKLDGDTVFQLHDTFGFPMDLTRLIAQEKGHGIDSARFVVRMEEQRAAGRANWKGSGEQKIVAELQELSKRYPSRFDGYSEIQSTGNVLAVLDKEGKQVEALLKGQEGRLLVDVTPFYPEGGGQVGDRGWLTADGANVRVLDAQRPAGEAIHHIVKVEEGRVTAGVDIEMRVDRERREDTRRNHTATHLLHAALRSTLGGHVAQKGSLVDSDRLRFDFSHHKAMTRDQVLQIQEQVQSEIFRNVELQTKTCTLEEAKQQGAMALFGEKYGSDVRVVAVPGFSVELCGGTHVPFTGEIGLFHITSESGVSAGVRRIEAITGTGALQHLRRSDALLNETSARLKTKPEQLQETIKKLLEERKTLQKELETARVQLARASAGDLRSQAREINGIQVLAAEFEGDPKALREEADRLRDQLGSAIVVLGSRGKAVKIVAAITKDIAGKRAHAGDLIRHVSRHINGGGGGRPDMAQAGGKNPDGLPDALKAVYEYLEASTMT
jgi:alanyl-tRNA synthetase